MNRSIILNYMLVGAATFLFTVVVLKSVGWGSYQIPDNKGKQNSAAKTETDIKGLRLLLTVDSNYVISKAPDVEMNYPTDANTCVRVINAEYLSKDFFKRDNAFVRAKLTALKNGVAYIEFEGDPEIITEQSGSTGAAQTHYTITGNLLLCRDVSKVYYIVEDGSHFGAGEDSIPEIWNYADIPAKQILLPKLIEFMDRGSLSTEPILEKCKQIRDILAKSSKEEGAKIWKDWFAKEKNNLDRALNKR